MPANNRSKARKPGRPRKYEKGRIHATVRFMPERYRDLKAAADNNRRSISEEVEARIEQLAHMLKIFNDERGMLALLDKQNDDAIEAAMHERKWPSVSDIRYGGKIFFRPGQLPFALPQSHWVDEEAEAREKEARAEAERKQQQQFEERIERAVTRALAKARLTIGGESQ